MVLRPYQIRAVEAVFSEWEKVRSTMLVMATGLGKTKCFSEIVRRMHPKRSLVIAHRTELIHQAAKHVRECGLEVEIEKADLKASTNLFSQSPIVVASVQTLISGGEQKRMHKFKPTDFGLLVIDEFHHATSASYRQIIDYFKQNPDLKVFGCTATPDRADKEALSQVCESVAFRYDVCEAIQDGWLVPIEQRLIRVGSLDFSHVKTTAGDLNGADLEKLMVDEKNLQGLTGATLDLIGDKKTICFTAGVRHAEMCAAIFNRHRSGMAAWVFGETKDEERAIILKDFYERQPGDSSKPQVLVNVGVATEGFDAPDTECIVMGRPTKSRALFAQMIGRGTRAVSGVLDEMHSAYERKQAIAESRKPACVVLDFVGNSGKHKLVTTADILGGNVSDEAKALALKKAEKADKPVRMQDLLQESEDEVRRKMEERRLAEEARKAKIVAKVQYSTKLVNPFDVFDLHDQRNESRGTKPITETQRAFLMKIGVNPENVDFYQAREITIKQKDRWKKSLASVKQCWVLRRYGYQTDGMTFREASVAIDMLAKNGWKRPQLQPA